MVLFKLKRCTARLETSQSDDMVASDLKGEHKMPLILEEVTSTREGKVPISGAGDIVVWVHKEI